MEQSGSESEKFITSEVILFINKHIKAASFDTIDEIVLSYVVTVLESLATDTGSLEDLFDVNEFFEMLTAYFPGFETISHSVVTGWIFDLVERLRKESAKNKPAKEAIAFESFLREIDSNGTPRPKRNSESSDSSSYSYGNGNRSKCMSSRSSRSPRMSETSDGGDLEPELSEVMSRMQACEFQSDDHVQTLMEMFPNLPKNEIQNILFICNGDLEKGVQMALVEAESGDDETIKKRKLMLNSFALTKGKSDHDSLEEKVLKQRIVERYGYIDQAEDKKEFRPPPLKTEPKKLVRYRESQVVSTKGERYTEVRCGPDGGEVKNYIYKPPKQF